MTLPQLVVSLLIFKEVINVHGTGYYNVGYVAKPDGIFTSNIAKGSARCNSHGRYLASAHNEQQVDKLQQLCQVFSFDYYSLSFKTQHQMLSHL